MNIEEEIEKTVNSLKKYNKIHILVLSGGSLKGIAYVGVIKALKELGIYENINIFAGTSIGSIFCFLLCIGYKYEEIKEFIMFFNFNDMFKFNLKDFYFNKGLNNGEAFNNLIDKFLLKKNFNKDLTFKELYEKTNKELIINSTNITEKKTKYFNYKETPDFKIKDALRMSMSLPFIFTPVKYEDNYYVDGGVMNSFLYRYMLNKGYDKNEISGVLLYDELINNEDNFMNYVMNIYYSTFDYQYNDIIEDVIVLKIKNCNSLTTFNIDEENKKLIIKTGYETVLNYYK